MPASRSSIIAVVLAGGLGTRVRELIPDRPKPMALVAGQPFLEWVLRYLAAYALAQIVVSAGYLAQVIQDYIAARPSGPQRITCHAEGEPLGTAGGLVHIVKDSAARPDAWLVLNGDSLALADLQELLSVADDPTWHAALVGVKVPDASRYGTLRVESTDRLIGFEEKRPGSGLINAGVYLLPHTLLNEFPPHYPLSLERDVFPALLSHGRSIKVVQTNAPFLDIGTPESLALADGFIRANRGHFAGFEEH